MPSLFSFWLGKFLSSGDLDNNNNHNNHNNNHNNNNCNNNNYYNYNYNNTNNINNDDDDDDDLGQLCIPYLKISSTITTPAIPDPVTCLENTKIYIFGPNHLFWFILP